MADFSNFMRILAAAFFVKVRMFKASSDLLPRIRSATNRAFLGAIRTNLNLALTSIFLLTLMLPSFLQFWSFDLRNGHERFGSGRIPRAYVRPFPL